MPTGHRDRPEVQMGTLWITASWIGAVLSVGLGALVYEALPETRLFIWGTLGLGVVIGAALWWRHR